MHNSGVSLKQMSLWVISIPEREQISAKWRQTNQYTVHTQSLQKSIPWPFKHRKRYITSHIRSRFCGKFHDFL